MPIHPTAVIDRAAEIDPAAEIGPFVVIDGEVRIGPGVRVYPHAYLAGWTTLAEGCEIHPNAVIGHLPQDFHFQGERSYCRIGRGTVIREGATVHRGAHPESATVIGEHCQLLCGVHVGHDVVLGNHVTLIPYAAVAGHAELGDRVTVSSVTGIHQFCRIGELAIIGAGGLAQQDVPPYLMVVGRNRCTAVNVIGMRRAGLPRADIDEVRRLYRATYRSGLTLASALESVRDTVQTASGRKYLNFFATPSRRGISHPLGRSRRGEESEGGVE